MFSVRVETGDGHRTRIRGKTFGTLRYRLDLRQAETAQVRRRFRAKRRAQVDQRPVGVAHANRRRRGTIGQLGITRSVVVPKTLPVRVKVI